MFEELNRPQLFIYSSSVPTVIYLVTMVAV